MMIAAVLLLLQGAAAAAVPPAAPPPPTAPSGGPRMLFISPAGEPFRGRPGEPYPSAAWFARADADHDGKLTRSEFRRDAMAFFAQLDVDGDGVIDAKEITRYEEQVAPETRVEFGAGFGGFTATQPAYPSGDPGSARTGGDDSSADHAPIQIHILKDLPRGAGRYGLLNSPEPVVAADTDLNRRVTQQEFAAAADRRFSLLDPDGVGYLTLAGLPQTPIQGSAGKRLRRK